MRCAEKGFILEVDLTRGNIERVETPIKDTELYIGGLGTNAKIFWDRVSPETNAFSPDNLLIFGTGVLCGTPATGATRTVVTTISPLTGLMGFSIMGSFWAPELKYAGYDKVVIRGKSPKPVYLWIHNDQVELRDASHFSGRGAVETQTLIQNELNQPRAQVVAIGLAGENRVYFASIEHDASSASRGGLGAVMGDKGLKAIAVRGTQDVHIAKPVEFMKLRQEVWEYMKFRIANPVPQTPPINEKMGIPQAMSVHDEKFHTDYGSWGNSRQIRLDYWTPEVEEEYKETLLGMRTRLVSCYNCPLQCKATISPPGQPAYPMKCYTKVTYLMAAYSTLDFNLKIAQIATEYGLDSISAPQVIAFALELLEWGVLKEKDFPDMPSDKEGQFYYLLDKIVRREGIGDILANGTYRAAREIGNGAEKFEHNTIKKQEQVNAKNPLNLDPLYYLMFATGEKIQITQIQGQFPQHPYKPRNVREDFVKDWFQVPDEKFKQYFVDWQRHSEGPNHNPDYPTVQMSCEIVDWMERMHYVDDSTGMCAGLSSWNQKPPYHLHNYPQVLSAATGIDYDTPKLVKATKRIRTLIRAINNRRGLRRKDDKPPEDNWPRMPELEEKLLDEYYKLKGWNKDSIPTKDTLIELGLDYVYYDFLKRGILQEEDSQSQQA